jgi:hypothetical protein
VRRFIFFGFAAGVGGKDMTDDSRTFADVHGLITQRLPAKRGSWGALKTAFETM